MARPHDETTRARTGPRPRGTNYERIENAKAPLVPHATPERIENAEAPLVPRATPGTGEGSR
ncbi:hypothetical protein BRC89_01055 [Halobacteriales archaeon QS_4_70_19]|nr:MAG: hypothetical protein BRC89_01055 [Halobacteriales archaeon QS_4_70_19]